MSRYEKSVQNQQQREGAAAPVFEAQARAWGDRVGESLCLLYHPGRATYYLSVKIEAADSPTYLVHRNGVLRPVAKEDVQQWLRDKPVGEAEAARQGVDKPVIWRTFKLESLISVALGGQRLRIRVTPGIARPLGAITYEQAMQRRLKEERQ